MVITEPQDVLCEYLCKRIRYEPTDHLRCIGRWSETRSAIVGVIGYDLWSATSVEMHVAGAPGFVTRELLYKVFSYPFEVAGLSVVLIRVSSANVSSLRFVKHVGFREMCRIPNAAEDGDLVVLAMQKAECRWLKLNPCNIDLKKVA